jgi:hypothetical protein
VIAVTVSDQQHIGFAQSREVFEFGRRHRIGLQPRIDDDTLPPGLVILNAAWPNHWTEVVWAETALDNKATNRPIKAWRIE